MDNVRKIISSVVISYAKNLTHTEGAAVNETIQKLQSTYPSLFSPTSQIPAAENKTDEQKVLLTENTNPLLTERPIACVELWTDPSKTNISNVCAIATNIKALTKAATFLTHRDVTVEVNKDDTTVIVEYKWNNEYSEKIFKNTERPLSPQIVAKERTLSRQ